MRKIGFIVGGSLFACSLVISAQQTAKTKVAPKKKISFAKEVAPIFKASCYSCHGNESTQSGLNLQKAAAFLKSDTIKKNQGKNSTLVHRIKGLDGLPQMPQGFKPLTPQQIQTIETWIDQGAIVDQDASTHWAYIAPKKPPVPLAKSTWQKNAIDAFILEKLTQQGLTNSAPAAREIQLRRLYLDLIGIPPTPEEVNSFLADTSANAYEKVVDSLLQNRHYGERQARIWLDLARYADSNGYEADRIRNAYLYRDWVIDAFNSNMKFDDFTIKQLAGDMIPNSSITDKIATGFHRNSMFNEEGGVNPAESRFTMVIDRVSTTSTVWLGSTVQCARCHDHKYDPFSQKDFFRMFATFGNTDYMKVGDYKKTAFERWYEPTIGVLPQEEKTKQLNLLDQARTKFLAETQTTKPDEANFSTPRTFTPVEFATATATSKVVLKVAPDFSITAEGENAAKDIYTVTGESKKPFRGLQIEAIADQTGSPGRSGGGNFVLTGFEVYKNSERLPWYNSSADFVQTEFDEFETRFGNPNSGWAISPNTKDSHQMYVDFGDLQPSGTYTFKLRFESPYSQHNLRKFRISTSDSETTLAEAFKNTSEFLVPSKIIPTVPLVTKSFHWLKPFTDKSLKVSESNAQINRTIALTSSHAKKAFEIRNLIRESKEIEKRSVPALILSEKPTDKPLTTPVYHRGEFTSPTGSVTAGIPTIFGKLNENTNRLSFAKWLVTKQNPLTARVTVNRVWEQYFGRGLVDTVEDFGTQGSIPSHQKLLDWLACEFMDSGWDMKKLHRLITTSATYRQSSVATQKSITKDPLNVYLSRGPRFRMEAEMIRDTALRISGLLNDKIGGPSVMPYQPDGVWNSPYNGEQWNEMKNADRYRRGLYVFVKRTSMYPSFMALDATSREVCSSKRLRTNTPLQALTLLNDRAFFEAAQALGKRMKSKGIDYGFFAATSRKPDEKELSILKNSFQSIKSKYEKDPAASKKIASTPEDAAWTMVGNIILNLDEVVTKS